MRNLSLAASLIKPVVRALTETGLTQRELLGGAIEHTDLMWQVPALRCEAKLDGVPISQLADTVTLRVSVDALYRFWDEALFNLRAAPYRVAEDTGWRGLSYALPTASPGHRAYCITLPDGFPSGMSDYAGINLSLECAHVLRVGGYCDEFVENENDYYATLKDGRKVGVKDGLPLLHSDQWDIPATGMVLDLLSMSRGMLFTGCDYDLVAKLRSVAVQRREQLKEFDGIDAALQALRVLSHGEQLAVVQNSLSALVVAQKVNKRRVQVVREAIEVAELFTISDRARVMAIRTLLVPEVLPLHKFRSQLYATDRVPAALTPKLLSKIRSRLRELLEEEISNAGH